MDFRQLSRYYDRQEYDNYDWATGTWYGRSRCQLKVSDKFQTIFHRPTRKRMLYCAPGQSPQSTVIRLVGSNQIMFVGPEQDDRYQNSHYRNVYGVHIALGVATITRAAPAGAPDDPGWLIPVALSPTTFGDVELRSLNENEESQEVHRGHYFLTFPSDTDVQRHDVVNLGGRDYYILEPYIDSNLTLARASEHGDPRKNMVFRQYTGQTYVNAVATKVYTNYNVTGRVVKLEKGEAPGEVMMRGVRIYIQTAHIGRVPKLDDLIQVDSVNYNILGVFQNYLEDHWELVARY